MKVFINPGRSPQGNPDPGAINPNSKLRECDAVLSIGTLLAHHLNVAGIETQILQDSSVDKLIDESNWWAADLFISLHCNSFNTKARGTTTWFYEKSTNGQKLAGFVQKQIVSALNMTDRGAKAVKRGAKDYQVLFDTAAVAIWIDLAYIDNDIDAGLLANSADQFARAIARGITDYQATLPPVA